ncbi:hypothetical protein H5410_005981 [Solanum commersonii]|uniref:Uncharacterized protein n=1 Tax=Solanum commersonii TaxID=4109 RepID=A0A9J6A904_SOLCO|nr:hypothetical protein H5410_005981 [Solanum commersonii]
MLGLGGPFLAITSAPELTGSHAKSSTVRVKDQAASSGLHFLKVKALSFGRDFHVGQDDIGDLTSEDGRFGAAAGQEQARPGWGCVWGGFWVGGLCGRAQLVG